MCQETASMFVIMSAVVSSVVLPVFVAAVIVLIERAFRVR